MRAPPWQISPGEPPSSTRWRSGDSSSLLDEWARWFVSNEPEDRQRYLDEHRAPALWRRWLDGYLTGRWDNPPAIFFRFDAPMARLVPPTVAQPDALEQLVEALERGRPHKTTGAIVEAAWRSGESPWGMVALLVWLGRGEADEAVHKLRKVERGESTPGPVGAWLRDRVPCPTVEEIRQRLAVLHPGAVWPKQS